MAYNASLGYDPNKDYSKALQDTSLTASQRAQLTQERQNKINNQYGGVEPTMTGSSKTFSQTYGSDGSKAVQNQYAGTNYHQDAINAAKGGDWDAVVSALNKREEKVAAQGDDRGKTSAEIYNELWNLYGQQMEEFGDFSYENAPSYYDEYDVRINQMLDQILNREKFSYNALEDPMYQQYKESYNMEGDRAMKNAIAEASARTGGMASSYATTAGQQANQYYAQQLANKIPELYELAYQMYLDDIELQVQDLGLLQGMSDRDYDRYRDTMSDWRSDRDFAYGAYRDDVADDQWQQSFDRSVYESDRDYDYTLSRDKVEDARYDTEWAHQVAQDELAADQWEQAFEYEQERDAVDDAQWQKEFDYQKAMDQLAASEAAWKRGSSSTSQTKSTGGTKSTKKATTSNNGYQSKGETNRDSGKTASNSGSLTIDQQSVLALGYGPISMTRLDELVSSGEVIEYTEGNKIKFKKNTSSVSWPSYNNWHY